MDTRTKPRKKSVSALAVSSLVQTELIARQERYLAVLESAAPGGDFTREARSRLGEMKNSLADTEARGRALASPKDI